MWDLFANSDVGCTDMDLIIRRLVSISPSSFGRRKQASFVQGTVLSRRRGKGEVGRVVVGGWLAAVADGRKDERVGFCRHF